MTPIEDKNLEIALKEYELATQHYFHEDKMKTDALKNSIIAVITIMSVATTIISTDYIKNSLIKILFSLFLGFSAILISIHWSSVKEFYWFIAHVFGRLEYSGKPY